MKTETARDIKIGIAQIKTDPGRIDANTRKIIDSIHSAKKENVDLLVFPELTIPGYLSRDLFLRRDYIAANKKALAAIAPEVIGMTAIIGFADYVDPLDKEKFGPDWEEMRYNSAAVIRNGEVIGIVDKTHHPNYSVFDEKRYFAKPRDKEQVFDLGIADENASFGVEICEDMWKKKPDVTSDLVENGAKIIVNLSASPFSVNRYDDRVNLVTQTSANHNITVVYANTVGGQEHLVFDGQSIIAQNGEIVKKGNAFSEDMMSYNLAHENKTTVEEKMSEEEQIYHALVLGLKDYFRTAELQKAVIGLSGGIDSAVTAALTVAALGKGNVMGISMPSKYSSPGSIADAKELANNLGIQLRIESISEQVESLSDPTMRLLEKTPSDLTEQNLQARIRGDILMALANDSHALVINTGNKTELALGYCTLYGDMVGAIAPLADLNKLRVYDLAEYINRSVGENIIPQNTIEKPPSAELSPNQTDEGSLGANYEILSPLVDSILAGASIEDLYTD